MHEDVRRSVYLPRTHEPLERPAVPQMITMSRPSRVRLAYRAPPVDVNYAVRGFPRYGSVGQIADKYVPANACRAVQERSVDFVL